MVCIFGGNNTGDNGEYDGGDGGDGGYGGDGGDGGYSGYSGYGGDGGDGGDGSDGVNGGDGGDDCDGVNGGYDFAVPYEEFVDENDDTWVLMGEYDPDDPDIANPNYYFVDDRGLWMKLIVFEE